MQESLLAITRSHMHILYFYFYFINFYMMSLKHLGILRTRENGQLG